MSVCVCVCVCELLDCMSAMSDASPSLLPVCKYIYTCAGECTCACACAKSLAQPRKSTIFQKKREGTDMEAQ